jgi:hypothetical protein
LGCLCWQFTELLIVLNISCLLEAGVFRRNKLQNITATFNPQANSNELIRQPQKPETPIHRRNFSQPSPIRRRRR